MKVLDPAYLAGVMDSDGSFSVSKHHTKRPNPSYVCLIQLTWTLNEKTKAFMEQLVIQYGGSFFCGQPSGTTNYPNTQKIIKYTATATAAEKITRGVLPHLVLKKQQAENILKTRRITRPSGASGGGRTRSVELSAQLHQLYLDNKALNSKNGQNDGTK
jgi:hypothetical protein